MKARPYAQNPFKEAVLRVVLGTAVGVGKIRRAYLSLKPGDRDRLAYVRRLLRLEKA